MVKALEGGDWNGQRYWIYWFRLDGAHAQDVLVGRKGFLDPVGVEGFKRFEPDLGASGGEIGDGFLLAQKRDSAVFIALGYIGWAEQLVIGSSALNEVISGFNPPRNHLVLYRRDIEWLRGLRDKKTLVAKELAFQRHLQRVGQERARDRAIDAAMLARRAALKAGRERREQILANLQAITRSLRLEGELEPEVWGFKFLRKLGSLEKRLSALEAKQAEWRMASAEEMKKLSYPIRQVFRRLAQEG